MVMVVAPRLQLQVAGARLGSTAEGCLQSSNRRSTAHTTQVRRDFVGRNFGAAEVMVERRSSFAHLEVLVALQVERLRV